MSRPPVVPFGPDALLVELDPGGRAGRIAAGLARPDGPARPAAVRDVVPGARTLLVSWRGGPAERAGVVAWLHDVLDRAAGAYEEPAALVELPVCYDGADLDDVARQVGRSVDEVVARHAGARYEVAFGGFVPGFAYLVGLDPLLRLPRLAEPRTRAPAGSVAVADEYTGVYPAASPGGWRLLGRTGTVLVDPEADPPALLTPGAAVRFVPVRATVVAGGREPDPGRSALAPTRQADVGGLEVLAPGPLTLVQDGGRSGFAAVGVTGSGAADPAALRAANRLVGNRSGAAGLEVLLGGLRLRARGTVVVALTGADARAQVDGREVACGRALRLVDGAELTLQPPDAGLRTWVAVRGGVAVPALLGSRSRDTLARWGPPPLTAGDLLGLGDEAVELPDPHGQVPPWARPAGVPVLELLPGPQQAWLADPLPREPMVVQPDSDRVALRLTGRPWRRRAGELPPAPLVAGAVQLPPSGLPVVFGPDHPVTGGYPVVGVLTAASRAVWAQLRPGDEVVVRAAR